MSNSKLMHNEPGIIQTIKKIDRFGHFLETVFGAFCVFYKRAFHPSTTSTKRDVAMSVYFIPLLKGVTPLNRF